MMKSFRRSLIASVVLAVALGGPVAWARTDIKAAPDETFTPRVGQDGKDVIWVPTSQSMVDLMLDMAQLKPGDRLVDLGSGDGVTVITAAMRGATARGIEFNPDMVALSKRRAQAAGVADRASFEQADIFASDFSDATVVTLFLLPNLNLKLRPTLLDMPPGTRIVANSFDMEEWEPDRTDHAGGDCTSYCHAMMWIVPARVSGTWEIDGKKLELGQKFQIVEGALHEGGTVRPIQNGRLEGARIRFAIGNDLYVGDIHGERMQGTINGSGNWQAKRASGS